MGRGNKHYSKEKERCTQARNNLQIKHTKEKVFLREKINGLPVCKDLLNDVEINYDLTKKALSADDKKLLINGDIKKMKDEFGL